jgi:hypothetical protein
MKSWLATRSIAGTKKKAGRKSERTLKKTSSGVRQPPLRLMITPEAPQVVCTCNEQSPYTGRMVKKTFSKPFQVKS